MLYDAFINLGKICINQDDYQSAYGHFQNAKSLQKRNVNSDKAEKLIDNLPKPNY